MTAIVFYFQVHQPYRLRPYGFLDIGEEHDYFGNPENEIIAKRVAERCYLPMNAILLDAIERTDGRFKCSFSLSGTVLRQLEEWVPDALASFQALADTGSVEILCETAFHSLAFLGNPEEFDAQVEEHRDRVERLFGTRPTAFRNTELVIDDDVARRLERLGFDVLLGEGADHLLGWRSPCHVYRIDDCRRLRLLLRSYEFSDDIAFRFSNREWESYPLMADTFASWLHAVPTTAQVVGLFMDYETFGEHQGAGTGILDFMEYLPGYLLEDPRFRFRTPSEAAAEYDPVGVLHVPKPVSWADAERDLTAWLGNHMQRAAHEALYELLPEVRATGDPRLLEDWRRLSTSDHVYYMSTKFQSDGDVHEYFSPWDTPHDAFITFMNVLEDLTARTRNAHDTETAI